MNPAALVPVQVEGWMLFGDGRDFWIKDADLAARAELANPRDIRTHIKKAIEEGVLVDVGVASGHANPGAPGRIGVAAGDANNGAYFHTVTEVVTSGKGRAQPVTVYYLNREAAVLITMRLKTPKALQLQVAVVRVFLLAVDGKLGARPPALDEDRIRAIARDEIQAYARLSAAPRLLLARATADHGLSRADQAVFAALAEYADPETRRIEGLSMPDLATKARVSERTVLRSLDGFERVGLVTRIRAPHVRGRKEVNVYVLKEIDQ